MSRALTRAMLSPTASDFYQRRAVVDDGCWLWRGARSKAGYGQAENVVPGIPRGRIYAHQLAYLLFRGNIPADIFVCHHCDNPPCVNPAHLWLGSNAQNLLDKDAKGRTPKGDDHVISILTSDAVRDIRLSNETSGALAQKYGVSVGAVTNARRGATWASVAVSPVLVGRARGERIACGKLTESDVIAIRASRESSYVLAERYGVAPTNVWSARVGRTWKHVAAAPAPRQRNRTKKAQPHQG